MKRFFLLILFSFSISFVYSDEKDIYFDITEPDYRMIQTVEIPYAVSNDFAFKSHTMSLTCRLKFPNPTDTIFDYSLQIQLPISSPSSLPRHSKMLIKTKDGHVIEYLTSVNQESSDCTSFDKYGKNKWHISYTFMLSKQEYLQLMSYDIIKIRFQTPWNNSVVDLDSSCVDKFVPSVILHWLYEAIHEHLKLDKNLHHGF